jgi:hypothetical protein
MHRIDFHCACHKGQLAAQDVCGDVAFAEKLDELMAAAVKPSGTGGATVPKGTASGPASREDLIKAIRKYKEDLRTVRSKTFKESQF